ncbi:hypothetical protein HMPREF9140_01499 [Prevotella micans F0438]|uniref:Uncharacterized protein n=1 Tax=Prevotella micans F0438 TaxID=883158 RepID=H1Q3L1_9BACT|nr:hypothetical protein HMPREF9140_01499 [Prevotella micans F0438]
MVSAPRNFRKRKYKWFQPRGTSANENTNSFGLAELPQTRIQMVSAPRNFRKRKYRWFQSRGTSANEKQNCLGALHCWQLKIRMNIHFKSNYK